MNTHIPSAHFETVTVKRKTAGTRSTFTTVQSNVDMMVQPQIGGGQFSDMLLRGNQVFLGVPKTTVSGIAEGDLIDRSGTDLYVLAVETYPDYQELILVDSPTRTVL